MRTRKDKNKESIQILADLCRDNGRYCCEEARMIITADRAEGTDAQAFSNINEAIEWEKGYRH